MLDNFNGSDWRAIEMLGYVYYAKKGYRILIPLVGTSGYDFVVEKDGIYKKINAKVAGLKDKNKRNSWSISLARGNTGFISSQKRNGEYVDQYLVWLPHLEKFIELPNDFFKTIKSKSRLIPKNLLR